MANNRSKSLFRGPNVKHFALVHRSVRDPLSNDPESSDRVLAEVQRGSSGKGKGRSKADLEDLLGDEALAGVRANEGEAATYGILYDDTEYDYMQHLRKIGDNEADGTSGFLVEAPRKNDVKGKGKAIKRDSLFVLHEDEERARDVDEQQSYRDYLEDATQEAGLRPDMDPALREILEALEDDAYIDDAAVDEGDGDLFDDLLNDKADTAYRDHDEQPNSDGEVDESLVARIARHKASRPAAGASDDEYSEDEERDTITDLKSTARPTRKVRTAGSTAASSAFSMSSSSMFRNEGLRTLDDRFDQVEAMYADSDEEEASGSDTDLPEEINDVFDDFLENYKVVGKKMIPSANAEDIPALEIMRSDMSKLQVLESVKRQQRDASLGKDSDEVPMPEDAASRRNKWDCETVLSNYSNLENHPRIISLQKVIDPSKASPHKPTQPIQRISIDPKTGFPILQAQSTLSKLALPAHKPDDSDDDMSEIGSKRQTVTRPRDETPEQKKARKAEVRAAQQERRSEKAKNKQCFGAERKRQLKGRAGRLTEAADVAIGNARGIEVMRLT